MICICVDSVEVYAKLNYYCDRAKGLLAYPWEQCKESYIQEASLNQGMVLTMEELDLMMSKAFI